MNAQRHLEITLGNLIIQNCTLQAQIEELEAELATRSKPKPKKEKANVDK